MTARSVRHVCCVSAHLIAEILSRLPVAHIPYFQILDNTHIGYYGTDNQWVDGGFGAPSTCKNCLGNGNGCSGTFGLDPLAFKAGLGTHDWGMCESSDGKGCMHHECESSQTGIVVCMTN